jgi:hypothetical protein
MLRTKVNRGAFDRVRTLQGLLVFSEAEIARRVVPAMATVHREQEKRIFATEGAAGGAGAWPRLSPEYARRKRAAAAGGRTAAKGKRGKARTTFLRSLGRPIANKILVWSGETRDRFTKAGPNNIARITARGKDRWTLGFGARSAIASYHHVGAGPLPVRDMVKKTKAQMAELQAVVVTIYRQKVEQYRRAGQRLGARLRGGPIGGGTSSRAASPAP